MHNTFWKVQFCVQNSTVLKNITEGEVRAYHNDVSLFQVIKVGLKPRLGPYTPGKRCGTYCIGGCEPKGQYGRVREISPPLGLDSRTIQPVASCYTDPGNCFMDYINSLIPAVFPQLKFSLPIWSKETVIRNLEAYSGKLLCLSSAYLQKHTTYWDIKWGVQKGEMSLFRKYSKQQAPDPTMLFTSSTTERHQSIRKDHTRNAYKESFQINWTAFSRTCFPPWPAAFLISYTNVQ